LSPRATLLQEREGDNILVCLATRTLEWDLAAAGNGAVMLEALSLVMPVAGPKLAAELDGKPADMQAGEILKRLDKSKIKGPFAQALAEIVSDHQRQFNIPVYLKDAIEWVTESSADGSHQPQ